MPVIIGNTSEETLGWADTAGRVTDEASYASAIENVFGASARERILAIYPAKSYPTPRAAFVQVTTDAQFTCQSRRVARTLAQVQRKPVYRYIFAHTLENDPALKSRGAAHSIEQALLFSQRKYMPSNADRMVQRQMVGYWSRIARTGNTNGGEEPEWPAMSPDNEVYLEISAKTAAKDGPAKAHCDFWDTITFPWPLFRCRLGQHSCDPYLGLVNLFDHDHRRCRIVFLSAACLAGLFNRTVSLCATYATASHPSRPRSFKICSCFSRWCGSVASTSNPSATSLYSHCI